MNRSLLSRLLIAALVTTSALAQTATWTAATSSVLTAAAWNSAANWDVGAVPNSSSAVALLNAFPAGTPTDVPGAAPVRIDGSNVTVAEIRYQFGGTGAHTAPTITLGGAQAAPIVATTFGVLDVTGVGVTSSGSGSASLTRPSIYLVNGILNFRNQSSAGASTLTGAAFFTSPAFVSSTIIFFDSSSAGSAFVNTAGVIDFRDQSNAAQGALYVGGGTRVPGTNYVAFEAQSGAGTGHITIGDFGAAWFLENASAQGATLVTANSPGLSATIGFRGHSTADHAAITVGNSASVTFSDQASAGTAHVTAADGGLVSFRDTASAADATISGYHVLFFNQSSAGTARLSPSSDLATSSIEFRDTSSAAQSTITLLKLGEVDFADNSDAGTATVVISSSAVQGLVRIMDQASTAGLTVMNDSALPPGHGNLDISGATQDVPVRVINGNIDLTLGSNNLLLAGTAGNPAATINGRISGTGGINWDRPALLTITNPNNTFTGLTQVRQGTLDLAGGRISSVTIDAGATLRGPGQIAGNVISSGIIAPGSATATGDLAVTGSFTQTPAGTLQIKIAGPNVYDRLLVAGRSDFQGRVVISSLHGYVPVGGVTDFVFFTSGTGILDNPFPRSLVITEPFSQSAALGVSINVISGIAGNPPTSPGSYRLSVQQRPYSGFATTAAQSALAAHLDANLSSAGDELRALGMGLNSLTSAAQVTAALEALTPDRYSVLAENGFTTAAARQAVTDRKLAWLRDDPSRRGLGCYFEAGYRRSDYDALGRLPAARSSTGGGTAGCIWHHDTFGLGASLTDETDTVDLDASGSRAEIRSLTPSVFFQYASGRFFLNAAVAYSVDDYKLQRRIVYSGVDQTARADPSGRRTDFAVTTGYSFPAGSWQFTPYAGLLSSNWDLGAFTETAAGGAGITVTDGSVHSRRTRAGLDAAYHVAGGKFSPRLGLAWLHELEETRSFSARVADAGTPYVVLGRPAETDLLEASLAVEAQVGNSASFFAAISATQGRNSSTVSDLSAGLRWSF